MASRPGEENVATLFGDIHYFYGPPTNNPPHHRFDKGSYVYLFENAYERRARIEIANQPGTEHQDAFDGFLDQTKVSYSYKHQCLVSITVSRADDPNEWHLPTFDPRNENKYHYPLHSLDIYFWTKQDALQFVNGVRRVLPPSHVDIQDEPAPPPHHVDASSVVQQLENVAITDSQYAAQNPAPQAGPIAQPPPPPPPQQHPQPQQQQHQQHMALPQQHQQPPVSAVASGPGQASFAPMAYNPAAPAAPEQIVHREKTPPPDDGAVDPLAQAVAYDSQAPFSPGFVPPPGFQPGQQPGLASPGFPGPPSALSPPPPNPAGGLQRASTMPVQAAAPSPYGAGFPASPGIPPPPPGGPQHTQSQPQVPQQSSTPGSHHSGSFSGSFSSPPPQQQQQPAYSLHASYWTPTEAEANKYQDQGLKKDNEPSRKLEENAGRLERGVTGMLKKFEKKFG